MQPSYGSVYFDNIKVNEYPIYLRTKKFKIGMIPQNGGYFHDLTLIENLKAIGEIQIDNQHDMNSKINQLISRFELDAVISWWKKLASKRYNKLVEENRLRKELEVWTKDTMHKIDIIR